MSSSVCYHNRQLCPQSHFGSRFWHALRALKQPYGLPQRIHVPSTLDPGVHFRCITILPVSLEISKCVSSNKTPNCVSARTRSASSNTGNVNSVTAIHQSTPEDLFIDDFEVVSMDAAICCSETIPIVTGWIKRHHHKSFVGSFKPKPRYHFDLIGTWGSNRSREDLHAACEIRCYKSAVRSTRPALSIIITRASGIRVHSDTLTILTGKTHTVLSSADCGTDIDHLHDSIHRLLAREYVAPYPTIESKGSLPKFQGLEMECGEILSIPEGAFMKFISTDNGHVMDVSSPVACAHSGKTPKRTPILAAHGCDMTLGPFPHGISSIAMTDKVGNTGGSVPSFIRCNVANVSSPSRKLRCAYLIMGDTDTFPADVDPTFAPMAAHNWIVELVLWRTYCGTWDEYDAVYLCAPWDYHLNAEYFMCVLEQIEQSKAMLVNSLDLVKWMISKTYLGDLASQGIAVVPSVFSTQVHLGEFNEFFTKHDATRLVIKPQIGASALDTFVIASPVDQNSIREVCLAFAGGRGYVMRPFIDSIEHEGEYSVFFFAGSFSHAILKTPKEGDFRLQEEHGAAIRGITPEPNLLAAATRVLAVVSPQPVYVRIDFVRASDSGFLLMDLELIEPSLYLRYDAGAAERFVNAFDSFVRDKKVFHSADRTGSVCLPVTECSADVHQSGKDDIVC